jgi:hypothetical protein
MAEWDIEYYDTDDEEMPDSQADGARAMKTTTSYVAPAPSSATLSPRIWKAMRDIRK